MSSITAAYGTEWVSPPSHIGKDAKDLDKLFEEATRSAHEESISLGERRRVLVILREAYKNARVENWDGEGSAAAEPKTYEYACLFLALLPVEFPSPDAYVDSDGEIVLGWDRGQRRVFTVSISHNGTLAYAGLFGVNKAHGAELLEHRIPQVIEYGIARVLGQTP